MKMPGSGWIAAAAMAVAFAINYYTTLQLDAANQPSSGIPESSVRTWDQAKVNAAKWGEMRIFFRGDGYGATNLLAATAVVKPGESVHPAHRHAEEEFLVVTEGNGTWHLNGRDFPAKKGDVLYVAPWDWHGLVNTGDAPLTFFVARWAGKGIEPKPTPPGSHGK